MDKKRFLDLLRNLQNIMKCPACGSLYNVEEMQFMGSQDGYFLLSLTCSKCSLPVWVNIFAGGNSRPTMSDLTITDLQLVSRGPVTADEVIEFHNSLKKFNGDFKKAFRLNKSK